MVQSQKSMINLIIVSVCTWVSERVSRLVSRVIPRLVFSPTSGLIPKPVGSLMDQLVCKLVGSLMDKLVRKLVGRLMDKLSRQSAERRNYGMGFILLMSMCFTLANAGPANSVNPVYPVHPTYSVNSANGAEGVIGAILKKGMIRNKKSGVSLTISCGSIGQDFEICKKLTDEWSARTGHKVSLFTSPNSSSDILALFRQQFGAKSNAIDVLMVDIIWPGVIQQHLIDLTPYAKGIEHAHFPVIIANNTIDGKLLAMPWFTDIGLLYYRRDLLQKYQQKIPSTWEELAMMAKKIQDAERVAGNRAMHGYIFQGKANESLTCNALEWISGYHGGSIIEADGHISIDNPQAIKALNMAASWVGQISPRGVMSFAEEEGRSVFQNGNAVFMRNWPYVWSLLQQDDSKVKDKVGVAVLPKGGVNGQNAATLGGWQLGVSRYSRHPAEAADLVMFLTSREVQKQRAISGSFNPTFPELYHDPDVQRAAPFMASLSDVMSYAVARPALIAGDKYNAVSAAFWNAAYATLTGKSAASDSLRTMSEDLAHIRRGDAW